MSASSLVLPDGLPASVREAIGDATVVERRELAPGTEAYVLAAKTGWPHRLLKVAERDPYDLLAEVDRLSWLDRRLPVPRLLAAGPVAAGGHASVLNTPAGVCATSVENPHGATRSVELAASALRFVHEIPVDDCPFSQRLDVRLRAIDRRLRAGQYEGLELSSAYRRHSASRLFEFLTERRPSEDDVVFSHGAFGPDAVWVDGDGVTGIMHWARSGIADRYADLARGAAQVAATFGVELVPRFFECYGIPHPEPLRLDYYQLLAEFP
jgi:aminoglycoside 3'-phosphotransferase-2